MTYRYPDPDPALVEMMRSPYRHPVADIFHALQSEGHFVGYPMVFVRLGAYPRPKDNVLATPQDFLSTNEIVARVASLSKTGIVCVIDDDSLGALDLRPLIGDLIEAGYRVHVETSGRRSFAGYPLEWLTVSPKSAEGMVQKSGHTLKIEVRAAWGENAWRYVRKIDEDTNFFHRYLQAERDSDGAPFNQDQVIRMLLSEDNAVGRWAFCAPISSTIRSWGRDR